MVHKPVSGPKQHAQSTVTATTQLSDPDRVYEWNLSISDLKDGHRWLVNRQPALQATTRHTHVPSHRGD
ncbi:hypothetical protein Pelo_19820 [Pelomyxa schiedti]|nr:hypothetical protein Pelo_19820 [Pelomyxa schiedti]